MQYPTLSRSTVRHVELVALAPTRLLVVLILSTGRVEQRLVELDAELDRGRRSPTCARGSTGPLSASVIAEAATALRTARPATRTGRGDRPRSWSTRLVEAMSDHRSDERIAVGGTANLARFGDSFDTAVRPLLEALEEHVVLLKLLGEASTGGTVTVRIGHEGPYQELVVDQRRRHRLRPRRRGRSPRSASSARPAWTTRDRWRPCARWPATSRASSTRPEPSDPRRPNEGTTREPGPLRPLGCRPRRGRRHHQEGLPTPGPPAAPRRQPRPGDPGAVQGGLARLRGAVRPAEAGGVRPRRRPVRRAAAASARARASRSPTSWTRSSAARAGAGGAGPRSAAARAPRPGRPDPARDRAGRGGVRRHPRAQGRHRRPLHDLPRRRRRARHPAGPCETCRGAGEVAHVQRSFLGEIRTLRPCAACRGFGVDHPRARAASAPATAGSAPAAPSPSRSPPASTPAPASSSPSRARSAPAAARPATSTSRSTSPQHADVHPARQRPALHGHACR